MAKGSGDSFLAGAIIGGLAGFALGILLAPKSGAETRADVMDRADMAREALWDRSSSARDQLVAQTNAARAQIEDLIDSTSQRVEDLRSQVSDAAASVRVRAGRSSGADADEGATVVAEVETAPQADNAERSS